METIWKYIQMLEYPITALCIVLVIPTVGWLIEKIEHSILQMFAHVVNARLVNHFLFYTTFPGVVHHELAHALVAMLTGAKVTQLILYKPEENQLGCISYIPRGPIILQSVQHTLTGMAPVFCGMLSIRGIYVCLSKTENPLPWYLILFLVYLMVSISLHMTMSSADYKNMWKGVPIVYVIVFHIVVIFKISIFTFSLSTMFLPVETKILR